jgi:hypothetical protein
MQFKSTLSAVALWAALAALCVTAPAFGQGTDASVQANALFED